MSCAAIAAATDSRSLRSVKLTSRAGLGICQARICGRTVEELLAEQTALSGYDPARTDSRPIAVPIRLGELARTATRSGASTDPSPFPERNRMTTPDLGGVIVATALPYREDASAPAGLAVDYDTFAEHCRWLVDNGCRGVGPNGSLGEYSSLTDDERRRSSQVARSRPSATRGIVVVGVHGVGSHQARMWAEMAAEDGADGVLCLPPTMYRANPAR